jgi:hypothetical protein
MYGGRPIQPQSTYRSTIYAEIVKKCALGLESRCWRFAGVDCSRTASVSLWNGVAKPFRSVRSGCEML